MQATHLQELSQTQGMYGPNWERIQIKERSMWILFRVLDGVRQTHAGSSCPRPKLKVCSTQMTRCTQVVREYVARVQCRYCSRFYHQWYHLDSSVGATHQPIALGFQRQFFVPGGGVHLTCEVCVCVLDVLCVCVIARTRCAINAARAM